MEVDGLLNDLSIKKDEFSKFSCFDVDVTSKQKSSQLHWDFVLKEVVSAETTLYNFHVE